MSKIFNDPIHGRIEIPDYCVAIIDTLEFQRLRSLKQLGPVSYVFHGATHTRFEHSIGTCWLAEQWMRHFQKKQSELDITEDDIKIVTIAGLVHDLGHGPFSHTFERFIKETRKDINYCHEDMTIKIFKQMNCCTKVISESVCDVLNGTCSGIIGSDRSFMSEIINNTINGLDCDKLDYFIRDSQFTSFAIGCDWKRILFESKVSNGSIVYPEKLVGDIFNLYQTRFRLYKEVYFHKTVVLIEDLLLDLLIVADSKNVFNFSTNQGQNQTESRISLADSINSVDSFLLTQDDIIGQMERCCIPEVVNGLNKIKTRNFKINEFEDNILLNNHSARVAHYGTYNNNPLDNIKFIDKNNYEVPISDSIINSMCPKDFVLVLMVPTLL